MSTTGLPEFPVEVGRSLLVDGRQDVAVSVHRYGDLAVAKTLLDYLGVLPGCKHHGGVAVAQVVEADRGQFRLLQQRLKHVAQEIALAQVATLSVAEYGGVDMALGQHQ